MIKLKITWNKKLKSAELQEWDMQLERFMILTAIISKWIVIETLRTLKKATLNAWLMNVYAGLKIKKIWFAFYAKIFIGIIPIFNSYDNYARACDAEYTHPEYVDNPERTNSQERLEAHNYLNSLDRSSLTEEEAEAILEEYDRCSPRWN